MQKSYKVLSAGRCFGKTIALLAETVNAQMEDATRGGAERAKTTHLFLHHRKEQ
jgi:hypothetical protein